MNEKAFIEHSPKLYDIGRELFNSYQQELIKADAVASGALLNGKWNIEQDDKHLALIFNLQDYWKTIEYGRKATKKAEDGTVWRKIKQWILVKGIVFEPKQLKNGKQKQPTLDEMTHAITKSIHKKGYKAKHPLEKALNNNKALVNEFVDLSAKIYTDISAEINDLYKL